MFCLLSAQTIVATLFMDIDPNGVNDAMFHVPTKCNAVSTFGIYSYDKRQKQTEYNHFGTKVVTQSISGFTFFL